MKDTDYNKLFKPELTPQEMLKLVYLVETILKIIFLNSQKNGSKMQK